MNQSGTLDPLLAEPLRDLLPADLLTLLTVNRPLTPVQLARACTLLRTALTALTSFVPAPLVREQMLHPEPGRVNGRFWNGSILFADLSGFTTLSGQLSALGKQGAEEISSIVNQLFGALVMEAHRYAGSLLKFGGDALTVFFDADVLGADHALLAARTALAMQARMAEFATLRTRAGAFRLRLRIGVHSGRVFAAQVGDRSHIELIVTGSHINTVARIQEIAEPGQIVISEATRAQVPYADVVRKRDDCWLLHAVPEHVVPTPVIPMPQPPTTGDTAEIRALAERIAALRPYLPRNLPRRFLERSLHAVALPSAELGEFRQVTVLFANFAPFSVLLEHLGNATEIATQALNAYYHRAQAVVQRYGGIINKVDMAPYGDKLMALFGAPIAHEDDPDRAVRAALELQQIVAETNREMLEELLPDYQVAFDVPPGSFAGLQQKIGINTGVVFAGQVGTPERREYTVMGQPVNLAARLMAAAATGDVILSPSTRRAVEGRFVLRDGAPVQLKGLTEPVPMTAVVRAGQSIQPRRSILTQAQLIGREAELQQIEQVARTALQGSGQVIGIIGDPGIGKSRLLEEALQRLVLNAGLPGADLPSFWLHGVECQGYDQNTPFTVIRALLMQLLNLPLHPDAGSAELLTRRVTDLVADAARFTPLLSDVLGLSIDETPITSALTPEQRHDRLHDLIEALVLAEARTRPLIMTVDDVQWADASSIEILTRLAERAPRVPLLLLFAYRTAMAEPWRDLPHCTRLHLHELPPHDSARMVRGLLQGEPPFDVARLTERTQGNPFYIEEVMRSLIDSGALQRNGDVWSLTGGLDDLAIPDSVEGVILARLDRLDERDREIVQVAAVIGRRFVYQVLSNLLPNPADLPPRLTRLIEDNLVEPEEFGESGGQSYVFRHALMRDVAYESILYSRRRELHRRVAQRIERTYAGRLEDQLALLARHYLLAEDWPQAFDYHLRAGRLAQQRFANREAINLLQRTLEIAAHIQAEGGLQERTREYVELHERLGVVHALIGEYGTALTSYQVAMAALDQSRSNALDNRIRLHHHIARVYEKRAEFERAFTWVERALQQDPEARESETVRCLLLGAGLYQRQGRYQQALEWGERARQRAERLGSERLQAEAFMILGGTYEKLGDNHRAFEFAHRSLELYENLGDLTRQSDAHNNIGMILYNLSRLDEASFHYRAGAEIKQRIGDVYGQALIANNLGDLLLTQGNLNEAIEQFQRSLEMFDRLGSLYATGVLHMNLGAVYLAQGDFEMAEAEFRRSADLYTQINVEDFQPELERYLAELLFRRRDLEAAHHACLHALETAKRLAARAEEGATRRLYGLILAQLGELQPAWIELNTSLAILSDSGSPREIARTRIAMADLAPRLQRAAEGQNLIVEAVRVLQRIGAQRDLSEAQLVAAQEGYVLS